MAVTYRVPQGLVKEILAVKGANMLLTTSYHTPRDKQMERAKSYQASLEARYINEHPHVGSLLHPDHRRNLQTLLTVSALRGHPGRWTCREQLEWYRFENSNFVRASSLSHLSLCHRLCPTTAATMQTPTPKAPRQCQWQSLPPPRCAGGTRGRRGSEPGPCRACPSRFA
jgi:hypothetical protein